MPNPLKPPSNIDNCELFNGIEKPEVKAKGINHPKFVVKPTNAYGMNHLARIETSRFPIRFNARGEDVAIPVRSDQVSDVPSTSKGSGV